MVTIALIFLRLLRTIYYVSMLLFKLVGENIVLTSASYVTDNFEILGKLGKSGHEFIAFDDVCEMFRVL